MNDVTTLAAQYHFPLGYSCRAPETSQFSGRALPTPGPSTVQMALIRTGIELFGYAFTRHELFPHIVGCRPEIRPPDIVAIAQHLKRGYKSDRSGRYEEAPINRELAIAEGSMTIYATVPVSMRKIFTRLFHSVGYWGTSNSVAYCFRVEEAKRNPGSCIQPVDTLQEVQAIASYYTGFATELEGEDIQWSDLVVVQTKVPTNILRLRLFVWPLILEKTIPNGQLLKFHLLA
jgi:hypothetical protein